MSMRLCIIGVGLIGGSLALAARRSGIYVHITGFDTDIDNVQQALKRGVIDQSCPLLSEAVENADIVVIATPVGATKDIFRLLLPLWSDNTVYTDVGSTKQSVIKDAEEVFSSVPENFVAGHPIAGTEKSGAMAAFAELFDEKQVILTPTSTTKRSAIVTIRQLWEQAACAIVTEMNPENHDQILAATSHLPHIAAFALVNLLASQAQSKQIFQYAASGFKDFTRIAGSDPRMWTDICIANRQQIIPLLERYQTELGELVNVLVDGKKDQLEEQFYTAQITRNGLTN